MTCIIILHKDADVISIIINYCYIIDQLKSKLPCHQNLNFHVDYSLFIDTMLSTNTTSHRGCLNI